VIAMTHPPSRPIAVRRRVITLLRHEASCHGSPIPFTKKAQLLFLSRPPRAPLSLSLPSDQCCHRTSRRSPSQFSPHRRSTVLQHHSCGHPMRKLPNSSCQFSARKRLDSSRWQLLWRLQQLFLHRRPSQLRIQHHQFNASTPCRRIP
jgi:hypothetical protein